MRYCVMMVLVLILAACASQAAPTTELPPRATVAIQATQVVDPALLAPTEVLPNQPTSTTIGVEYLVMPPIGAAKPLPEPLNDAVGIGELTPWRTVGFGIPYSFAINSSETLLAIGTTAGVVYAQVPSLAIVRFDRFVGGVQAIQFDDTGTMLDVQTTTDAQRYNVTDGSIVGPAGAWNPQPIHDPSWIIRGPLQRFEAEFQVPDTIPPPGVVIRRVDDGTPIYEDSVSISASFSPNERYVVLNGNDETLRLVDLETGAATELVFPAIVGATFSPDGQTLLTSGTELYVWDVVSGRLLQSKPLSVLEERPFISMEFSTQAITFDSTTEMVTVFGSYSGFESESPQRTTWSLNGSTVADKVWDDWLPSIGMQTFNSYRAAVNPAKQLVAVTQDGFGLEWLEGDQTIFVQPLPIQITALEFSPDGTLLAIGLSDGRILLTQVSDYSVIREIQTNGTPDAFGFSFDGTLLAGASREGNVTVWKVADGSQINQFTDVPIERFFTTLVRKPIFTADNEWILMPNAEGVNVYAVAGAYVGSLDAPASTVALGPFRRLLLTVDDGIVTLWGRE